MTNKVKATCPRAPSDDMILNMAGDLCLLHNIKALSGVNRELLSQELLPQVVFDCIPDGNLGRWIEVCFNA
jgi:hypothetical protein